MSGKRGKIAWLGIGALAIFMILTPICLTLWLGSCWHLSDGEKLDLGQLIVALLLIPAAIVAFWQARDALKQSIARPSLRIAFLGDDGLLYDSYVMRIPSSGGSANHVTLAMENIGDAIAVWWQAQFDIPVEMMKVLRSGKGSVNVMPRHSPILSMDTVGDVERRVVQSAGTIGLFPGPPLQIARIEVDVKAGQLVQLERIYQIKYVLFTDRSDAVVGELPLKIYAGSRR